MLSCAATAENERWIVTDSSVDSDVALITDKITARWIRHLWRSSNCSPNTGKKQGAPEKQKSIERKVAPHLVKLKRGFDSGEYNEYIDQTHFVIDFNNNMMLESKREKHQIRRCCIGRGDDDGRPNLRRCKWSYPSCDDDISECRVQLSNQGCPRKKRMGIAIVPVRKGGRISAYSEST